MSTAPTRKKEYFQPVVRSLYLLLLGVSLAALSPTFAHRLLDLLGTSALGLILPLLATLVVLLFIVLLGAEDGMGDEALMMLVMSGLGTLGAAALLHALLAWLNPFNGWAHLSQISTLESARNSIVHREGSLEHPANRRIAHALQARDAKVSRATAHWWEAQDALPSSETERVLVALSVLGQANHPRAVDIRAKGWAGAQDLAALKKWALATPPAASASPLQANAWLHLVGEIDWSQALEVQAKPATPPPEAS